MAINQWEESITLILYFENYIRTNSFNYSILAILYMSEVYNQKHDPVTIAMIARYTRLPY